MYQGFTWFAKALIIIWMNVIFSIVLATELTKECFFTEGVDEYPVVSIFLSRSHFRDSCDPEREGKEIVWCVVALVAGAGICIYSGYFSERIERSSFDAKYEALLKEKEVINSYEVEKREIVAAASKDKKMFKELEGTLRHAVAAKRHTEKELKVIKKALYEESEQVS